MKIYHKAVLPSGFLANGISCGIKKSGKADLALFYSKMPAKASCKFTSSSLPAAPILLNRDYLKKNRLFQAVIANSGNANCFTGKKGLKDAQAMSSYTAKALGLKKEQVLVNSTGIIGRRLPVLKIKKAIVPLVKGLGPKAINKASRAILTTDNFAKEVSVKIRLGTKDITFCGVAKGAGMIAPDMATMLCFIFTDANISQGALTQALTASVEESFNCITVDGCMSTNDTVILLANAAAANPLINTGSGYTRFAEALKFVCLELAKMIVHDAEGATKFIRIKVSRARNKEEAKKAGLYIANSDLFKTAMYGQDPNFGRVVAALGASGIKARQDGIKIKLSPLQKKEIDVAVELGTGNKEAVVYTCDLTPRYIKINAAYN